MESLADGTLLGQPWWHFVLVPFFAAIGWGVGSWLLNALQVAVVTRGRRPE